MINCESQFSYVIFAFDVIQYISYQRHGAYKTERVKASHKNAVLGYCRQHSVTNDNGNG